MQLGRLQPVDLRKAWPHEAKDFTPWLAENLDVLSEVTELRLRLEDTEVDVEGFSADLMARDSFDDSLVLIENQLEGSDHTHLGQIMTYLAGLDARAVIWIAREFHGAHLSAIRWLNSHTPDTYAFFAVRVKVVRIANSPIAPVFEVLERPIAWERGLRSVAAQGLSEIGRFRKDFWTAYAERYPDDGISPTAASSVSYETSDPEMLLSLYLAQGSVGIFMRGMRGVDPERVADRVDRYKGMLQDRFDIDLGERTSWGTYRISDLQIDSRDRENWPRMIDWLHEAAHKFLTIFEDSANGAVDRFSRNSEGEKDAS
jgi:hypothetical protein